MLEVRRRFVVGSGRPSILMLVLGRIDILMTMFFEKSSKTPRHFFFWSSTAKNPMGRGRDDSPHSSRMEMLVVDSSATSMCNFPSRPIIPAPASTL